MHTFQKVLSDYFIRVNNLEIIGESIRQTIAKNPYFQIETIFERLDKFRKGFLVPSDFSEFMLENKIYPQEKELYVIFRDFDEDRTGIVTLQKLKRQISPRQNLKLKKEALMKKYYPCSSRLQIDLEFQLSKYFQHKIRVHDQFEQIRSKLIEFEFQYQEEAFALIDKQKRLFITKKDIDFFMRKNGKVLKADEVQRIFRVIGDLKECSLEQEKLYFDRFSEILNPFSLGFYRGYSQRLVQKNLAEKQFFERKLAIQRQNLIKEKRSIEQKVMLENLRNSNLILERQLIQKEMQIRNSRLLQESLRRIYYY